MFAAWGVIIPFGSFIARYLKKYTWWFNVHRTLNTFAVLSYLLSNVTHCITDAECHSSIHLSRSHGLHAL